MKVQFVSKHFIYISAFAACFFVILIIKFGFTAKAEPQAAVLPPVTATKAVGFATGGDVDSDGKADPGDTLQYTVTVNNGGTDATGVTITDTL